MLHLPARAIAALFLLPVMAQAGARQDAKVLMATDQKELQLQQAVGFSDAVITGDTIYFSGLVADLNSGERDLVPAYERAFARLGSILERAGASWDDVVEITSFHTDMLTQMGPMIEVKKKYIREPHPAWTAVEVAKLGDPRALTEIRMIAKLPHKQAKH
jgi:enamine deaminase RidA (YjgF/YER057c/UK114 family)